MVTVSRPSVTEVSVVPKPTIVNVSPPEGFPATPLGPQQIALVNTTGVKMGSEAVGSPLSGASMIHSAELPLNVAPGGGASVIEKYWPVASLAKYTWPAVWLLTYMTEQ